MKITSGPNWQFYAVTAFIIYWCVNDQTIWPILGWIAFWIVMIPVCIKLHKWNEAGNAKILRDFPNDSYIQAKYGKKK